MCHRRTGATKIPMLASRMMAGGDHPTNPAGRRRNAVAFHVHGLTKIYRSGEVDVAALRGVELDIFESEVLVLLGPSGSGKSTFLNILGGLDRPSAGDVL